jgi:hypothetical protein
MSSIFPIGVETMYRVPFVGSRNAGPFIFYQLNHGESAIRDR